MLLFARWLLCGIAFLYFGVDLWWAFCAWTCTITSFNIFLETFSGYMDFGSSWKPLKCKPHLQKSLSTQDQDEDQKNAAIQSGDLKSIKQQIHSSRKTSIRKLFEKSKPAQNQPLWLTFASHLYRENTQSLGLVWSHFRFVFLKLRAFSFQSVEVTCGSFPSLTSPNAVVWLDASTGHLCEGVERVVTFLVRPFTRGHWEGGDFFGRAFDDLMKMSESRRNFMYFSHTCGRGVVDLVFLFLSCWLIFLIFSQMFVLAKLARVDSNIEGIPKLNRHASILQADS